MDIVVVFLDRSLLRELDEGVARRDLTVSFGQVIGEDSYSYAEERIYPSTD